MAFSGSVFGTYVVLQSFVHIAFVKQGARKFENFYCFWIAAQLVRGTLMVSNVSPAMLHARSVQIAGPSDKNDHYSNQEDELRGRYSILETDTNRSPKLHRNRCKIYLPCPR